MTVGGYMTVYTIVAPWIPTTTAIHIRVRWSIGMGISCNFEDGNILLEFPGCVMWTCCDDSCKLNISARHSMEARNAAWKKRLGLR